MKALIIIPAFNESESIKKTIEDIPCYLLIATHYDNRIKINPLLELN